MFLFRDTSLDFLLFFNLIFRVSFFKEEVKSIQCGSFKFIFNKI